MPATPVPETAPVRLDPQTAQHLRKEVARLVHDLRQPLTIIETCAYLADQRLPTADTTTREHLSLIFEQLGKISQLVDEMLCAAQIAAAHREQEEPAESRSLTNSAMGAVT